MFPEPPIHGQTPLDDLSGLKVKGITTQAALNAAEAENIRRAVVKYLAGKPTRRSAKFTSEWLLKLHGEMFGRVWRWAGEIRTVELNIGSPPHQVRTDLHHLVEDLHAWKDAEMPLLEQAARLHHRAVLIHPFRNGNGRWARMLGNIWLRVHDAEPVEWPEMVIGTSSTIRDEYIAAVRAADRHDYSPLIALHARFRPKI